MTLYPIQQFSCMVMSPWSHCESITLANRTLTRLLYSTGHIRWGESFLHGRHISAALHCFFSRSPSWSMMKYQRAIRSNHPSEISRQKPSSPSVRIWTWQTWPFYSPLPDKSGSSVFVDSQATKCLWNSDLVTCSLCWYLQGRIAQCDVPKREHVLPKILTSRSPGINSKGPNLNAE